MKLKKGSIALLTLAGMFYMSVQKADACTRAVYIGPDHMVVTGRTMDWKEDIMSNIYVFPRGIQRAGYNKENAVKWTSKYGSVIATGYDIGTCDGMNEKGLAVGVLLIDTKPTNQNTKKVDITTTTAIRMMLDKAKNVDEALELLSSYDMHSSANSCYHFQICDASGKSVVVEYVDNEMKVVYPDKNYQCATNFLLTQPDAEFNFGQDRYQIIDEKLSSTNGKLSNREAMQLLSDCSQDAHKNKQGKISKTQWSCVYDLKNKKVTVCVNQNYDAKYTISVLE